MTKQELSSITIPCERCKENPAKHLRGGSIVGVAGLWLLCDECLTELEDKRKSERRK